MHMEAASESLAESIPRLIPRGSHPKSIVDTLAQNKHGALTFRRVSRGRACDYVGSPFEDKIKGSKCAIKARHGGSVLLVNIRSIRNV